MQLMIIGVAYLSITFLLCSVLLFTSDENGPGTEYLNDPKWKKRLGSNTLFFLFFLVQVWVHGFHTEDWNTWCHDPILYTYKCILSVSYDFVHIWVSAWVWVQAFYRGLDQFWAFNLKAQVWLVHVSNSEFRSVYTMDPTRFIPLIYLCKKMLVQSFNMQYNFNACIWLW